MKYVVKNRLKGGITWIKVATFKTWQQAEGFIIERTEWGFVPFQEWTIEEVANG